MATEEAGEVIGVWDADACGDLMDREMGGAEEFLGSGEAGGRALDDGSTEAEAVGLGSGVGAAGLSALDVGRTAAPEGDGAGAALSKRIGGVAGVAVDTCATGSVLAARTRARLPSPIPTARTATAIAVATAVASTGRGRNVWWRFWRPRRAAGSLRQRAACS